MMMKTHLAFGAFFALVFLGQVNSKILFVPVVLLSALLPDLDVSSSYVGSKKVFRPLQWVSKHRGFVHSLTFCFVIALLFSFIYPPLALGFFVGFVSHLFIDSFTHEGIRPFWPLKGEISGKIRSDGRIEKGILYLFAAADIILLIGFIMNFL